MIPLPYILAPKSHGRQELIMSTPPHKLCRNYTVLSLVWYPVWQDVKASPSTIMVMLSQP